TGECVAPYTAVNTYRRCRREIPLARIVLFKGFIRKHACRTHFSQVATEFILKNTIITPAKVDAISGCKRIQIMTARVILVEAHAPIALYTSVHFMIEERTEVLIPISAFVESELAIGMASHHGHIL